MTIPSFAAPPLRRERLLLLGGFVLLALALRPLLFLAAPGLLFAFWMPRRVVDPVERLALALGGSAAFWVVLFWFLDAAGLPFVPAAWAVVALTAAGGFLGVWRPGPAAAPAAPPRRGIGLVAAVLLAACLTRLLPVWTQLAPSGADMSMHSYVAALVVEQQGIPASFEPILPFRGVAAYAPGFHTLMALAATIGGAEPLRAGLFVSCAVYALFALAAYAFLRRFAGPPAALAGALLAAFAAPQPQNQFASGTTPSVLALCFAALAGSVLLRAASAWGRGEAPLAGLLLAACPLTHSIPAVVLLYCALPLALLGLARANGTERRRLLGNGLAVAASAGVLLVPYLLLLELVEVSPGEIEWALVWQEQLFPGGIAALPGFVLGYGGRMVVALCALAGVGLLLWRDARALTPGALALVLLVLLAGAKLGLLPFAYALYPDRVIHALILPLAAFFAVASERLGEARLARGRLGPGAGWLGVGLAAVLGVAGAVPHYHRAARAAEGLSEADGRAFEWMRRNLPDDAVVLNNYGDAGLWIPAMTKRRAVVVHTTPFFLDELRALQLAARPGWIYLGDRAPYPRAFQRADVEQGLAGAIDPVPVFEEAGAALWRVRDPERVHAWHLSLPRVRHFLAANARR